jgi:hypothetical protein
LLFWGYRFVFGSFRKALDIIVFLRFWKEQYSNGLRGHENPSTFPCSRRSSGVTETRRIAALVLIETDDPRLFPDNISVGTVAETAALRQAVIENLPKVARVIFLAEENTAELMALAHEAAMQAARPPADYVAPGRD